MRVETALTVAITVVIVLSLAAGALVPGALAEDVDEFRPSQVHLDDATVAAEEIQADTVTLRVTAFLDHRSGETENLSVHVRVTDEESGLHETTQKASLEPISGDREVAAPVNVTVPREGDYQIEVRLYKDDKRLQTISRTVRGVGSLRPVEQRSPVEFHQFDWLASNDSLPPVQYSVDSVQDGQVTLDVSTYLTNSRGYETGDLEVEFVLRQADSNVVATRERVAVGDVPASKTANPSTTVTVPDGYNYYIDVILWKDGVIVDNARGIARLNPSTAVRVNQGEEDVGLKVGDFARDDSRESREVLRATEMPEETPGFGPIAALIALLFTTILLRRHA